MRTIWYMLIGLLLGAGVGVVYINDGMFEALVLPGILLVRTVVLRCVYILAEALVRWGWNQTFWFLFLLSLPTLWRRTITRGVLRAKVYCSERRKAVRRDWLRCPRVLRTAIAAGIFCMICFLIAYAEEAIVFLALLFVTIPFLTPVVARMQAIALRFGARVGVFFGFGLFLRRAVGNRYIDRLHSYQHRCRRWRWTLTRKFFAGKRRARRVVADRFRSPP